MKKILKAGTSQLTELEAKAVIAEAGIATTAPIRAASSGEAASLAREIGFPVALKIDSPDIVHKSDVGGVMLGLAGRAEVVEACNEMLTRVEQRVPTAIVHGVTVQPMAPKGIEVIVGAARDPQFGPVLMLGSGGVLVDLLKDVSFRVVPIDRWDAGEMIRELRGYPLLEGFRGQEPVSISALEDVLLRVSGLMEANPAIRELDLNPVLVHKAGAVAVDARIALEPREH